METSMQITYVRDPRASALDTTVGIWGDYDNIPE
jgi:hypothetical protein